MAFFKGMIQASGAYGTTKLRRPVSIAPGTIPTPFDGGYDVMHAGATQCLRQAHPCLTGRAFPSWAMMPAVNGTAIYTMVEARKINNVEPITHLCMFSTTRPPEPSLFRWMPSLS